MKCRRRSLREVGGHRRHPFSRRHSPYQVRVRSYADGYAVGTVSSVFFASSFYANLYADGKAVGTGPGYFIYLFITLNYV